MVGTKADHVVNGAIEAIGRWDPRSATEAELRTTGYIPRHSINRSGRKVSQAVRLRLTINTHAG